jgi:MerR family copper efflux transcriptional regulator
MISNVSAMRIGELKLAGISTSALRYYEEAGLLGPAGRTEAGYRKYGAEAVGRLQFVQRAKALGLSLQEVRQLLASPAADVGAERDRLRHLVAHKLAETRARIAELHGLEQELEALYVRLLRVPDPDCGHLADCGCWLPTDEEVKTMAKEVACCGQLCCPNCACSQGQSCDCPDCPCNQG